MLLKGKNIVIFGGSGAIGTAMAKEFVAEGGRVWLGARNQKRLDTAADKAGAASGTIETFKVDCLDATETTEALSILGARIGGIDVAINATSFMHDQGSHIDDLDLATFMSPVENFLSSLFNSCKAVVPHMGKRGRGVILTLSTPAGRTAPPGHLGYSVTCAGVEAFSRVLAAELGPRNIRVVCLGPHAISDAPQAGSYTGELFAPKAGALGLTVDQWLGGGAQTTMLGRLPTLDDVAQTAAFLASDKARSMTAAYVNLTAGMIPE
ncbi:NADP-dependent 3-hydroxy acid dehydrogenase YdfG [Neorhizobium sp. R1-B]|uniref:SDR family NAD(P)-dependent oxidoreductase n=1 Tax=Neorhizobium sp. R1-B TaxID=2485162 RepID=UPI0010650095|nr:SDR family oxidoreductase [Neorhizobium sp. R1-B]TDX79692.1 NADP-dependent 3-hydroxy acid dehydrogenase YdfG [Neorhizobium sp. R1-B]